jgi:hypothetical protein
VNVRERLDNIARGMNARHGPCVVCGADDSRPRTVVVMPPRLAKGPPEDASPCRVCGRPPLIVEIILVARDTPAALQARGLD